MGLNQESLDFEGVRFRIRRVPRKRSISISIRPNGRAHISAGMGTPIEVLRSFLLERRNWVLKVKSKFEALRKTHPPFTVQNGQSLFIAGQRYSIVCIPTEGQKIEVSFGSQSLIIRTPKGLNENAAQDQLLTAIRNFLKRVGQRVLPLRVRHLSRSTGLQPTRISIRGQKTKWGACNAQGLITLNWKLVCAPPGVIDYVIIHELCHLRHLNHSARFWSLVESHCSDWKKHKTWLRENSFNFDFLNEESEIHEP